MTAYAFLVDADQLAGHHDPWALLQLYVYARLGNVSGTLTAQTFDPAALELIRLGEPGEPERLCRIQFEPHGLTGSEADDTRS